MIQGSTSFLRSHQLPSEYGALCVNLAIPAQKYSQAAPMIHNIGMLRSQKIVVVMPAYNAARTLRQTYAEVMAHQIVDEVILVDDASKDDTVAIARELDRVQVEVHPMN